MGGKYDLAGAVRAKMEESEPAAPAAGDAKTSAVKKKRTSKGRGGGGSAAKETQARAEGSLRQDPGFAPRTLQVRADYWDRIRIAQIRGLLPEGDKNMSLVFDAAIAAYLERHKA